GLQTMAAVFTALGTLLSTLGAGAVIVQRKTISDALLRSLATLGLATGLVLFLALGLSAGAAARFYGEPAVADVMRAMALNFVLVSIGMVPEGLLQRELRFSRLVVLDLVALVIASVGGIGLAVGGYGVWALILPNLAASAVRSLLLLRVSPWPVRLGLDASEIRGVLGFSSSILGFNALQYMIRNTDRMIIGKALGTADLGLYDYAYRFYMYPLEVVTGILLSVLFPTFARMQESKTELGRAFLRANAAIALVTFPMMAGLAAVAGPFVRVVLGEQWEPVIPLVQILAPLGAMQSIAATPGQIFLATGNAALRLWWSIIYTSLILLSFWIGVNWGIIGIASAYSIVMVPICAAAFWLALRLVDLPLSAIGRALWKTTAAALAMAAVVQGIGILLESRGFGDPVVLAVCIPLGVVSYGIGVAGLRVEAIEDVLRLLPLSRVPGLRRFAR
ncbi:lipopolysaccharide biosynthesis protein, partial [Myxococcota bacterium]|nr:lipopolysaccharide biosynthesis protein [Myxococcota bacterium]